MMLADCETLLGESLSISEGQGTAYSGLQTGDFSGQIDTLFGTSKAIESEVCSQGEPLEPVQFSTT